MSFEISVSSSPTARFLEIEAQALWGTEGPLYRIRDLERDLAHLPGAEYLMLQDTAAYVNVPKRVLFGTKEYDAVYCALLAVDSGALGKGLGKAIVKESFARSLEKLEKGVIYAYIEAANQRSLRIFEGLGFETFTFYSAIFSRLRPGRDPRAGRLSGESVVEKLEALYSTHGFVDVTGSFRPEDYYVLRDGGKIVAGVQCLSQRWEIDRLTGVSGKLVQAILPLIPVVARAYDFSDFRFLKVGNFFAEPGCEHEIFPLIEFALAENGVHAAMAYFDVRCPFYRRLAAAGKFGWLNKVGRVPAKLLAYFKGFTAEERADLRNLPVFVSALDL